jgi:hypothetical protein
VYGVILINLGFGFDKFFVRVQGLHFVGDFLDHINELGGFRGRYPGKLKASRFNAGMFQQVFHEREFSAGVIITFQVMAFAGMSSGHPDRVGPTPQAGQNEFGAHAASAGDADHPDIGRIFHPADPGQVGCPVTAPTA